MDQPFAIALLEFRGAAEFVIKQLHGNIDPAAPSMLAIILGWIAVGISFFSGWLGGELVYRLNIAVDEGAHPDAPSSLSGRPAREHAGGAKPV